MRHICSEHNRFHLSSSYYHLDLTETIVGIQAFLNHLSALKIAL